MTDVKFFQFCDAAALTQDNKIIAHGIFETLGAQKFPVVHPSMAVVFRFEGSDVVNGAELTFRLTNARAEKDMVEVKFPLNIQIPNNSFQGVISIVATQFDNPGAYQGVLLLNGKQIATAKLIVNQLS